MTNDPRSTPEPNDPEARSTPERFFPVIRMGRIDGRFTDALLTDVADVLAAHGYPVIDIHSPDYEELGWAMWRFIYGRPNR